MSDTPTPETDSFTHSADEMPFDEWVYAGHAMRLERERDEAKSIISAFITKRIISRAEVDAVLEEINEPKEVFD